jgi:hypothetical protein
MVVRLYAFFSEQTVRMATPNRSAVRNALAKLVQAHMNLENTTRAKNLLKNAINNHLRATINRNKAINHVLKKQRYKYSNANRANIVQRVGTKRVGTELQLIMNNLPKLYNINPNTRYIQKRPMLRRVRNAKQRIPGMKNALGQLTAWYKNNRGPTPAPGPIALIENKKPAARNNSQSGAVAARNHNSGATVAGA